MLYLSVIQSVISNRKVVWNSCSFVLFCWSEVYTYFQVTSIAVTSDILTKAVENGKADTLDKLVNLATGN